MREYTAPIYDTETGAVVGSLTFQAKDFDEADRKVDQWSLQHIGEGRTASSLNMTWKRVETPELGDIHLA